MKESEKEFWELKHQLKEEQELRRKEKETQQEEVQQEAQHAHIDETIPIQVIDSSKQLAQSRQGEQSQEQYFAQEIE